LTEELRQGRGDDVRLQSEVGADLQPAEARRARPTGRSRQTVSRRRDQQSVWKRHGSARIEANRSRRPVACGRSRLRQECGAGDTQRREGAQLRESAGGAGASSQAAEDAVVIDEPRAAHCLGAGGRRCPDETSAPTGAQAVSGTGLVDRKSTRLNSSHVKISYAVFCLKK